MKIFRELLLYVGVGIVLSIVATFPLFQHSDYISNHGDINRGLIYSGIARNSILEGRLPTWNQYLCGGSPLLADVESWFMQPFFFLTLPFNEVLGMKISFALTLGVAFVGFALLGRRILRFQILGALIFGLVLAFGGYISQHLAEGYYVWVASAWIPWFLLAGITSLHRARYVPFAGLLLAFMFGAGSMHMVVYSVLFLLIFFVSQKAGVSFVKRAGIFIGILACFLAIASVKLIPTLSVLSITESRAGFTPPITLLPKMLFGRGLLQSIEYHDDLYRWSEFGNYIGIIAPLLALIALLYARKGMWSAYRGFFIASIIMLGIAFTPFPLTHGFISHITDLFRMPSRLMLFPLIGVGILTARGLEIISMRTKGIMIAGCVVVIFAFDLVSSDYTLFARTFSVPLPNEIHIESKFMRVKHSYTTPDETYYRAAYIDFLENRGTNDLCRFYQQVPATSAINGSDASKPDRGEVYLVEDAAGDVELVHRSFHEVHIRANIERATSIVVNMNYYPGWKTKEGLRVVESNGLVAIPVSPGTFTLQLYYSPFDFAYTNQCVFAMFSMSCN